MAEECKEKHKPLAVLTNIFQPANKHKHKDLLKSLSSGTGVWNWNLNLDKIMKHSLEEDVQETDISVIGSLL